MKHYLAISFPVQESSNVQLNTSSTDSSIRVEVIERWPFSLLYLQHQRHDLRDSRH